MKRCILPVLAAALTFIFFAVPLSAQAANDQYGFGNRAFLIQSMREVSKSPKGFWDVPGKPGEAGNFKRPKKDWSEMGIWEREKGDPKDRLFSFQPAGGSSAGRYYIKFARETSWGVNVNLVSLKLDARTASDHFELKYLGDGRWKIYQKPDMVVCLETNSSKNGVKLVVRPDRNGPDTEWMFFDVATNHSFLPVAQRTAEPEIQSSLTMEQALRDAAIDAKGYFVRVTSEQFSKDNSSDVFASTLNAMKRGDQWAAILRISNAATANKDIAARRAILLALYRIKFIEPGNALDRIAAHTIKKDLKKLQEKEQDDSSRASLNMISEKF